VAEKYGELFLDATQAFKERRAEDYYIYKYDGHPNVAANKIFADQIYPVVKNIINQQGQLAN
jgi:hypothetical protein